MAEKSAKNLAKGSLLICCSKGNQTGVTPYLSGWGEGLVAADLWAAEGKNARMHLWFASVSSLVDVGLNRGLVLQSIRPVW